MRASHSDGRRSSTSIGITTASLRPMSVSASGKPQTATLTRFFRKSPLFRRSAPWANLRRSPPVVKDAKNYEALMERLLPSLLYPQLDFAQAQSRTESGVSIRDLIFYNTLA